MFIILIFLVDRFKWFGMRLRFFLIGIMVFLILFFFVISVLMFLLECLRIFILIRLKVRLNWGLMLIRRIFLFILERVKLRFIVSVVLFIFFFWLVMLIMIVIGFILKGIKVSWDCWNWLGVCLCIFLCYFLVFCWICEILFCIFCF